MKSILRVCVVPKTSGSHLVLAFQEINNEANEEFNLKEAREVCLIKRVKNKSDTMQSRWDIIRRRDRGFSCQAETDSGCGKRWMSPELDKLSGLMLALVKSSAWSPKASSRLAQVGRVCKYCLEGEGKVLLVEMKGLYY